MKISKKKIIILVPVLLIAAAVIFYLSAFTPLPGEPKYIFIKYGYVNDDFICERFVRTDEIEKLMIYDNDSALNHLKYCKNMHHLLCLCFGSNAEFLNGLYLTELDLCFLNDSESNDLSTVSVLKDLKRLSVTNNGNKIDLSSLSELSELEYLDINLMYVSDLDFLAEMDSLEVVGLDRFKADDYSGLLKAASLKEIVCYEIIPIPEDIINELTERGVDVHLYE